MFLKMTSHPTAASSLPTSEIFRNLIDQYRASSLPSEVTNVLNDFFIRADKSTSNSNGTIIKNQLISDKTFPEPAVETGDLSGQNYSTDFIHEENAQLGPKSITDAISELIPDNVISLSAQYYDQHFAKGGCGCARRCHEKFRSEFAFETHLAALNLDQFCASHVNHQHLLLLGALNALMGNSDEVKKSEGGRTVNRVKFKFRGQEVCRTYFKFVYGCGEKRLKNILGQFMTRGLEPTQHENALSVKNLIKTDPNQQRREALIFILNFAQQNALQLPGRYTTEDCRYLDLYLFPAQQNLTRRKIYQLQYIPACADRAVEAISFALWSELWDLQYPNVTAADDHRIPFEDDACAECRRHSRLLLGGIDAETKLVATQRYLNHLTVIQKEMNYFRTLLDRCRVDYEELLTKTDLESTIRHSFISSLGSMHYTLDWFTTISLPHLDTATSRQPAIYIESGYKVALFGLAIEPLRKFILYIIPEFVCHRPESLSNLLISLIHHFFTNFQLNEKATFIHFANSSTRQLKNELLFSYFMWRSLIGHHDRVNLSFLPSSHARTWNDLFMGVLKKKLRNCQVTSLEELKSIAERCTLTKSSTNSSQEEREEYQEESAIQAFIVGDDQEQLQVPLYNWEDRFRELSNTIPTQVLEENRHFEINMKSPGYLLCRQTASSEEVLFKLIETSKLFSVEKDLPPQLSLEPMPSERRRQLNEIARKYLKGDDCASGKLWECEPSLAYSETDLIKRKSIDNGQSLKRKKKNKQSNNEPKSEPKCSYCGEQGHREIIFGRVRCPKKKSDTAILLEQRPTKPSNEESEKGKPPTESFMDFARPGHSLEPIVELAKSDYAPSVATTVCDSLEPNDEDIVSLIGSQSSPIDLSILD